MRLTCFRLIMIHSAAGNAFGGSGGGGALGCFSGNAVGGNGSGPNTFSTVNCALQHSDDHPPAPPFNLKNIQGDILYVSLLLILGKFLISFPFKPWAPQGFRVFLLLPNSQCT